MYSLHRCITPFQKASKKQENRSLGYNIWKKCELKLSKKVNQFSFLTYFFENYTAFRSLQSFTDSSPILM